MSMRLQEYKGFNLRAAQTGVDPFSLTDALVVRSYIVEAGVEVEHEQKIADGPNHSNEKIKI